MDIPSLPSAFTVPGGDSVQAAVGLGSPGSGADFAASLALPDAASPAPTPKAHVPKAQVKAGLITLMAQIGQIAQDAEVAVPICWQAQDPDAPQGRDILAKKPPKSQEPADAIPAALDPAPTPSAPQPILVLSDPEPRQEAVGASAPVGMTAADLTAATDWHALAPMAKQDLASNPMAGSIGGVLLPAAGHAVDMAGDGDAVSVPPAPAEAPAFSPPQSREVRANLVPHTTVQPIDGASDENAFPVPEAMQTQPLVQQTPPEKAKSQGALPDTKEGIGFAAINQGQAAVDPKLVKLPYEKNLAENPVQKAKSGSGPRPLQAAASILKATGGPPEMDRMQGVQPFEPMVMATKAVAEGDPMPARTGFAQIDLPDASSGPSPQAFGGVPAPHAHMPAEPSLPPKTAQALHAQLPAVIEHLQHGPTREGHSHAEVLLNPAELGRIRFDLITQGDQVQVRLAVERPETLDLLRAHVETLRQEFRAAGLNTDTLNFGQWSGRPPQRDHPDPLTREQGEFADLPQLLAAPYIKPWSATGLDLRL